MPLFHKEMYDDLKEMNYSLIGALWEMFRESAKTTLAKIKIIHNICYKKKFFNIWASFDQKKAEANLFDITLELQTNKKIINDFGQLFYGSGQEKKSEKKSIKEFITTNGIKVKAYSTGQSIRGEVFGEYRPDFIVLDDIETMKTIVSDARTKQVIDFIDELLAGASGDSNILVLANRLAEAGSVAYLEEKIKSLKDWKIRNIPVMDDLNNLIWPEKYCLTDKEANEYNSKIENKKERKISLETKKLLLGETVFNREMMNKPLTEDEREFKQIWFQNYYDPEAIKDRVRNRYIMIDIADTKDPKKSKMQGDPDYTGIIVLDITLKIICILFMQKEKD